MTRRTYRVIVCPLLEDCVESSIDTDFGCFMFGIVGGSLHNESLKCVYSDDFVTTTYDFGMFARLIIRSGFQTFVLGLVCVPLVLRIAQIEFSNVHCGISSDSFVAHLGNFEYAQRFLVKRSLLLVLFYILDRCGVQLEILDKALEG